MRHDEKCRKCQRHPIGTLHKSRSSIEWGRKKGMRARLSPSLMNLFFVLEWIRRSPVASYSVLGRNGKDHANGQNAMGWSFSTAVDVNTG